jgi:hypothetical protein
MKNKPFMKTRTRSWEEVKAGLPDIIIGTLQFGIFTWLAFEKPEITTYLTLVLSLILYFVLMHNGHTLMDNYYEENKDD